MAERILCRLFGHKAYGYAKYDLPYGRVIGTGEDGIGRQHYQLQLRCDRCDTFYGVGNFHANEIIDRAAEEERARIAAMLKAPQEKAR